MFKKFILHFSYLINFMDNFQVDQFCMLVYFILKKPAHVTYGFILTMVRNSYTISKESERVQFIIK